MKTKTTILAGALLAAMAPGMASAGLATWTLNYIDPYNQLGSSGLLFNAQSALVNEYKYTAESVVVFQDNDGNGTISAGDTFDQYAGFIVDNLFLNGTNTFDLDYSLGNVQLTGIIAASGEQTSDTGYVINSAYLEFYFDFPQGSGTFGDFGNFDTLVDGLLVQTGNGAGTGANDPAFPDGSVNLSFELTDVLSTLDPTYDPFEIFSSSFVDLDDIVFATDSNNEQCSTAGTCGSTEAGILGFFGRVVGPGEFVYHTRSDGSAVKRIPEPAVLGLLGLSLFGFGFVRARRARRA